MNLVFYLSLFLYVCVCVCILYFLSVLVHKYLIETLFRKNNQICYDKLLCTIQRVSKGNEFMNYGYWIGDGDGDLLQANQALVTLIFEKAHRFGRLRNRNHILDVGCGNGSQDLIFCHAFDKRASIVALDISETHITRAKQRRREAGISSQKLRFLVGDAMDISRRFGKKTQKPFDIVLNIESAFHYPDRPAFFRQVHDVTRRGGVFVVCDIVLRCPWDQLGWVEKQFLKLFSDVLCFPRANWVADAAWHQSLVDAGWDVLECTNITEKTLVPYYRYFFTHYFPPLRFLLEPFFCSVQPFSYYVAVCRRRKKE